MAILKERTISDVPFTGLVETLCMISLTCGLVGAGKDEMSRDDLLSIIAGISENAVEGLAFSQATREEIAQIHQALLEGVRIERIKPN